MTSSAWLGAEDLRTTPIRKLRLLARVINFAAFYFGWFACVVGAAHGQPTLGPLVVAVLIVGHLLQQTERGRELALIATVGAVGSAIDTSQAALGVFAFVGDRTAWLCPPWLTSLWIIFASTLNGSMSWLSGRYLLAAAIGAVSGPFSYYCAVRIGVIEFPHPIISVTALAVVWAATVPALFWLRKALAAPAAEAS